MADSVKPVSSPASPLIASPSVELPALYSVQEYLEEKNQQFVSTLAPTLCYTALMVLCGLAGNSLVFLVYHRRFKPSVTRTYILAMSVCDLLTNLLSLPADVVEVRFHNNFPDPWLCKAFRSVKSFLGFLAAFILVAVAFDRQRAICNPHSNPPTIKHTVVVLVVISVFAVGFTVPYSILIGGKTVRFPDSNITGKECTVDDAYSKSLFLFVYNMVTGVVLVVCICLMLGSYIRIARQLWLHKRNTASIISSDADRRKASALSSHAYTFEESSSHNTQSSSHNTQSSSDRSQQSVKSRNEQTKSDMTLAQIGSAPVQEKPLEGSCAETALDSADSPNNGACPSTGRGLGDDSCPQAPSPDPKPEMGSAFGQDTVATITTDSTCSEATLHSCAAGQKLSDRKHSGHASSSRSTLSRIRQTAKSFATRKKSTSTTRGSVKKIPTRTTFMMFVLTVIFIINYLPYLLIVSVRSRLGNDVMERSLGMNGYHLGLRSYFLNSAINPLVYSFCSARFRQECRRLFETLRRRRRRER